VATHVAATSIRLPVSANTENASEPLSRTTLQSIIALRAFIALQVVLHHMPLQLGRLGYTGPWPELFSSRVDLFFVTSGFVIWLATVDSKTSPTRFLYQRLSRVVPLYWLLTVTTIAMMLMWPGAVQSGRFEVGHVLATFAFLPAYHPISQQIAPVLVPGWTLNYEMFFYCVFALFLPLRPRYRLTAIVVVFVGLVSLRPILGALGAAGTFYTSGVLFEFLFGLLIGAIYSSRVQLSPSSAVALTVCGLAGLIFGYDAAGVDHMRVIAFGVPSAFLVAGVVYMESSSSWNLPRAVKVLSNASYAIYLSHGIVLSALCQLWLKLTPKPGAHSISWFIVTGISLSLVVAIAIHRLIEVPIANWFRQPKARDQNALFTRCV
jgi:exopolysaccharide production protein ExoZ